MDRPSPVKGLHGGRRSRAAGLLLGIARMTGHTAEEVQDFLINIGPQHPATHGVPRMVARLDGEEGVAGDPRIGYMHRSLEKLAEKRTYHQVVPFTDRTMDYVSSMFNNWVYCGAAEKLMDIE